MDQYLKASYAASKLFTNSYSTSFGLSIRLFSPELRPHIYAIYGLVRIADEIVDTYDGPDQRHLLNQLETETYRSIESGYSTNPIVHAFATTAFEFKIDKTLIAPFFESMRMDLSPKKFDQKLYETYIYGSAEVVGLMCLKVFTADEKLYKKLAPSASKLGSAYQKVNFLRDIAADVDGLGRWYFPYSSAETFDEQAKAMIIGDIEEDFADAIEGIKGLPESSRHAVQLSYDYYLHLLRKIQQTPAEQLRTTRVRVTDVKKAGLYLRTTLAKKRNA